MASVKMAQARRLIADYHQYEGDRDASVIRRIPHPDGGETYLVHFVDQSGRMYSSLEIICLGATGEYATEFASCPRDEEHEMVLRYLCL